MTISKGGTPTPTASATSDAQSQTLNDFAAALAAQSAGSGDTGKVWMPGPSGQSTVLPQGAPLSAQQFSGKWQSADDATAQYFNWTQKQRDDLRAKGLLSGLLTQGAGDMETYSLWSSLVKQASLYGAQGKPITPMDILSGYVKGNSNGGWIKQGDFEVNPVTGERRYIGPKFKTTTQTNVNLTDPATARAIATKVFQDLLGRDPGQGEISAYATALSQSEQQNPSMTTTTTQYDPTSGEAVGSSSMTEGGVTADGQALLAGDEIKKKKEYGATQAATTYQNALEQAVYGGH
jgi:hypothetical protein